MSNKAANNFRRTLRILASISSIVAGSLMLSAHGKTIFMDVDQKVSSGDIAVYVCFVIANFTIGFYNGLLFWLPDESQLWKLVIALDAILVVTLSSSCSAALGIGLMESNGNSHRGWLPICHFFTTYCSRVLWAIGFGYGGTAFYLMVQLLTIQEEINAFLLS